MNVFTPKRLASFLARVVLVVVLSPVVAIAADRAETGKAAAKNLSRGLEALEKSWRALNGAGRHGCVIWHRGRIVAEWYGGGFGANDLFEIGSLRKSFNAALIGVHGLDMNVRAIDVWPEMRDIPGGDPKKDAPITLHQLVSATSGWKTPRAPGEEYLYSNAGFTAAERVVARLLKLPKDETAPEVTRLFKGPLGATSWKFYHWDRPWAADRSTGPKLALDSNLRDLVKWGVLWHNGGTYEGKALIPQTWVRKATSIVNPHLPGPHYAYNWFINVDGKLWPEAPRDAFGHSGSGTFRSDDAKTRAFLWICPSLGIVSATIVAKDGHPEDFFEARSAVALTYFHELSRIFSAK